MGSQSLTIVVMHKTWLVILKGERILVFTEQSIADLSLPEQNISYADGSAIVGRRDELFVLHREDLSFIFIVGVAGVGKTSLAKKFAYEHLSMPVERADPSGIGYNKRIFWHTFKEIDTLTYLLGELGAFLSKNGVDDLLRFLDDGPVRTNIHSTRALAVASSALNKVFGLAMILDDYHKVRDENISVFIKQLLDHASAYTDRKSTKTKVLVLSRYEAPFYLNRPRCKELALLGLPLDDAKEIIDLQPSVDAQILRKVWKRYAGHPMALKIFSLFTKGKVQEQVKNDELLSNTPSVGELLNYFQREIFGILNEDELNLLTSLSVFRMPVRLDALQDKRMFRISPRGRNLNYVLHSLEKKMLVSIDPEKREIFLHDLLRDAVYSTLLYPADLHAFAARYYLDEGKTGNIIEALYHLAKCGNIKGIVRLLEEEVVSEKYGIIEQGYAGPLLDTLSGLDSIMEGRGKIIEAKESVYLYSVEGKALAMMQKWNESDKKLENAIKIARNLPDKYVMAYALKNYGEAYYLRGKLDIVDEKLHAAAEILRTYKEDSHHQQSLKN